MSMHRDYFGNPTHFIAVETAHQQLVVKSKSRIAVKPAFIPEPLETPHQSPDRLRSAFNFYEFPYAHDLSVAPAD